VRYEELRRLVQDGDLVAVRSAKSLLGKATQWATRSPYTHTAIALWLDHEPGSVLEMNGSRLLIAEMNGAGNVLIPLSQYADAEFDVFRAPVPGWKVRLAALELLGRKIGYGWAECFYVALNRVFGVPFPEQPSGDEQCAMLSAEIYRRAGWPASLPTIVAPCDVVAAIGGKPALVNDPAAA
jgi:hypothetical protein